MEKFKKGFMVGAATSPHQTEGNNVNSDCWKMEHMVHTTYFEPSMSAVDHYNRYEEDIALLASSGMNAYRFGIEWARIEPENGVFNQEEVVHYLSVIKCCKKYGVEPIITLHHFSSPAWLMKEGGWEDESVIKYFARYVEYVMSFIKDGVKYICTINEANMGLQVALIAERMKRQMMAHIKESADGKVQLGMNLEKMMLNQKETEEENLKVFAIKKVNNFTSLRSIESDEIVLKAHLEAKRIIKAINPNIKVGLTLSLHDVQYVEGGEENAKKSWDEEFTHYLPYIKDDDFLGVQNYTRSIFNKDGIMPVSKDAEITEMDYEFYPEALSHVIDKVHEEYKGDIIVTENGITTKDDTRRVAFIERALKGVQEEIEKGVPVKGYMYWSLLDNFEWQKGFSMTFGLISVDRKTMIRTPKDSLYYLGSYVEK